MMTRKESMTLISTGPWMIVSAACLAGPFAVRAQRA